MQLFYNREGRLRAFWRILWMVIAYVILGIFTGLMQETLGLTSAQRRILFFLSLIAATLLLTRTVDERTISDLGLVRSGTMYSELLVGIIAGAVAMSAIFGVMYGLNWLELAQSGETAAGIGSNLATYLVIMILVAIWEEMVFRGYLLINITEGAYHASLGHKGALAVGTLISSLLFGFAHFFNPNADLLSSINIMMAGVVLALPFLITGRLALSIGAHFGWNFFQGGVFGFQVSGAGFRHSLIRINETGPDLWTGGVFGPEAGLLGVFGFLIMLTCMYGYLKLQNHTMRVGISLKIPPKSERSR